jgi:hypothetical protein
LDEKSQTEELNEIRLGMRSDTTLPAVDKLWRFLTEVNRKMKEEKPHPRELDVTLLLLDVENRDPFNKLLNDIEKSFENDLHLRGVLTTLKSDYSRLACVFYAYAATIGSLGFLLLFLNLMEPTLLTTEEYTIAWVSFLVVGMLFLLPLAYIWRKTTKNTKTYNEKKKEYQDKVRV